MYARKVSYKQLLIITVTLLVTIASVLSLLPYVSLPLLFKMQYLVFTNKPKMLIVWRRGLGERECAERILNVMPKLGVKAKLVSAYRDIQTLDRYLINKPEMAATAMRPDFILTIDREVPPIKSAPNYIILDQSSSKYIKKDENGNDVFIENFHYDFTGLLPAFKDIDLLRTVYERRGHKYSGFNWTPTVHATSYVAQAPQFLCYPGGDLSDNTRSKEKYRQVFTMLDKTGYFAVYGYQERWQFISSSYRGFIPLDGVSLLETQNKAGITLVLHAQDHLLSGTPTGRIFEAVAANTVIITDKNQFIIDNFGDNVLYVDVAQSAEEVFRQIDQHMQWIFAHPAEAQKMAERCHNIFLEKFTLEQQMQRLLALAFGSVANTLDIPQ